MAADNNTTAVINRALRFIGERPIISASSPQTTAGKAMVDNFDQCRREVLRRVPWNFAECWAALSYFSAAPTGFDYQDLYALPADYIRIIDLPGLSLQTALAPPESITDYRLIQFNGQRCIALSNNAANTLNMAYVCDTTNLALWDPLALKVFAMWLAIDVAKGITGQDALVEQLNQMLAEDLKDAVGVNGNEQRKRRQTFSKVQTDRELAFMGWSSYFTPVQGFLPEPM